MKTNSTTNKANMGDLLALKRTFSKPETHPYSTLDWEVRSAEIMDESGKAIFKQISEVQKVSQNSR